MRSLSESAIAKVRLVPDLNRRFGIRDRAIVELLACGLRPEKIPGLDLANVAEDFSEIRTPDFSLRLSPDAKKYLRRYLEDGRPLALRSSDEPGLFITDRHGKRIRRSHLENLRRHIVKITGLKAPRILSRLCARTSR